jgi:microcystin-dependent protein
MAQPYVGEIRMVGFNFAPQGWALCNGQLMPITENEILFQVIGTTYGGDGQETFALPDLQSRFPVHMGQGSGLTNRTLGERAGVESVTLTSQQIPAHTHGFLADAAGSSSASPKGKVHGAASGLACYADPGTDNGTMAASTIGSAGGSQPHDNIPPYLTVNFIISLFGLYPTQA